VVENRRFEPTLYSAPLLGVTLLDFTQIFSNSKLVSLGWRMALFAYRFSCLVGLRLVT